MACEGGGTGGYSLFVYVHGASAQANVQGQWQTLPTQMSINPVHAALLHNGKVLIVSGSGNYPPNTNFQAAIYDPLSGTFTTQPVAWDMFCNGMVVLPDGRAFINSGTLQYDPFHGQLRNAVYDPSTGQFTDVQNMAHGRWYPTVTTLGNGSLMTFSGLDENGNTNSTVEIYTVGSGWSTPFSSPWTPPLYPRMHLIPNGKVFYSGSTASSRYFDPATHTWSSVVATTNLNALRTYGTSVLLPLSPANNYKPVVMIMGGGNPATNTTELIDLSATSPIWTPGPNMSARRIEMNATILPNGKVIALGGSVNDETADTAGLNADLYDPVSNTFTPAGSNVYPRLYHSNSLLLPDATVLVMGGNPGRGTYEPHLEVYTPPYLFNANGTAATRPTITDVPLAGIAYGSQFAVQTPDAANISSVVLIRPGTPTHAFDMEQRMVALNFSTGSGVLTVTAPQNGNIAPPGYYLLFVLNSAGVPSVAQFVQLSAAGADVPPTGTITSPTTNVTIAAGQSVAFSGSGNDQDGTISAYLWNFPGGSPSTSTLANPGNVIYSASGTFTATFTVTDNLGVSDPNPPKRTITVNQSPAITSANSATFAVGSAGAFTVTTTGFPAPSITETGTLPNGVTLQDNGTGTATLSGTPATGTAGTYPITIKAHNGVGTDASQSFTLTVNGSGTGSSNFAYVNGSVTGVFNIGGGSSPSVSVALHQNPGAGHLLVCAATWQSVTATAAVTDPKNGTWAAIGSAKTGVGALAEYSGQMFYVPAAVNASTTITLTTSAATQFRSLECAEYAYTGAIASLDGTPQYSTTPASGGIATIGGLTTSSSNDLVFAACLGVDTTCSAGSGYTLHDDSNSLNVGNGTFNNSFLANTGQTIEEKVAVATGTQTATFGTGTPTDNVILGLLAMKGAASAPDFSISATPSTQSVVQGGNVPYQVTVGALNGFSDTVNFSISGLPSGATASFVPTSVNGSGSSTLTVTTAASTPVGNYTLSITGATATLSHSISVTLSVSSSADFSISATPASQSVVQGGNVPYQVTVSALNGFSDTVNFSVSGLPSGATASFVPTSVSGSGSSTLTITTAASTPVGSYTLTIKGATATLNHSFNVTLGITAVPNFSISATPSTQSVVQGGNVPYQVTVGALNGFSNTVNFSVSGLPSGATASFVPTSVNGSGSSTLTITTAASTPVGTYTLTITGASATLSHSVNVTLGVTSAGDFSLSDSPTTLQITKATSGSATITVSAISGFTGAVSLSVSGLPARTSASWNPTIVSGPGSSTLTITVNKQAKTGTYNLTIKGTSGSLAHSIPLTLVVQ